MKKRLLSMILALSMVLTFLPVNAVTAFAADDNTCGDGLTWSKDAEGVVTITGTGDGTGKMKDYDLNNNRAPWSGYDPSKVKGVVFVGNVTSIGEFAFYGCSNVTSVTIPTSVTSIGKRAFEGSGLTSLKIPDTVTSVGEYAFRNCSSLSDLTIENNVISEGEFNACTSLTEVTIPGSVNTIGDRAFSGCSGLGNVTIENDVTAIGAYAFYCDTTKKDENSNPVLVTTPISVTIPNSVTSIGNCAFWGRAGLTSIELPSNITTISNSSFGYTGLTEVEIPDRVTSIEQQAFLNCTSLTSVSVPSSVTTIGKSAFSSCVSLKTVNIPDGVEAIEQNTFRNCTALESITIPGSVKNIYDSAFAEAGLVDLVIPEGVTYLGSGAFTKCPNLLTVKLPSSLKDMSYFTGPFQSCPKLWKVEFANPGNVSQINYHAFQDCVALTDVSLPDSLKQITLKAFSGCSSLEKIDLPQNVSYIGESAFQNCTKLNSVTIPMESSYSSPNINKDAFKGCTSLKEIRYKGTIKNLNYNGSRVITGLTGLDTGDTKIEYDGQTPIDLVYQCYVHFYTKESDSSQYSRQYSNDTNIYRKETVASDKAPTLESKEGYTLSWHVDSADGEEFVLGETPVTKDTSLYAVYTLNTKGVTVPAGVTVKDADGNTINRDGNGNVSVTPGQEITLSPTTKNAGDAYEWTINGNGKTDSKTETGDSITITVNDETEIKLDTLKALHITADDGKPNTTGTKYDETSGTYYGNGWEYSETAGLTIKADKDLSNEPAVKVAVTVENDVTVSNAKLTGDVTNNGTLSNCVLDKAPTSGTVANSLFGAKPDGIDVKTLTEADGKNITAKLDGVKDGSLTGQTLWFVGTPKLTAMVENTEIKHINHTAVTESGITGIDGNVTANADHSVTFTPDGNENILLNNRTAGSGDFTFTAPEDCTYDGNVHKVDDITSTTYRDSDYTVKYDYKKPDGTPGDETEEPKDAGTYTVKIVMSDGQTIDTGKSFTIKPAEPGKDDFEFVKDLPSGVTEDRDDSEKTAEVQLKSDSLFQKNNAGVEQEYQKKNADGKWEKVTAPSGKGEYKLVATVTTTDPNLTGGTVEWEFTILDREDANWLTMSVEDGKITKVTRPAADDAEAEEDITEKVLLTASADGSKTAYKVPAGAQVTVTANDAPQDMKFEMWRFSVNSMNGDTALALYSQSMTFKDDVAGLTVSAMYQDAAIDSGYDILGPAAAATTAVVGSAILAYQGHMLGTELYLIYLLPSGAVIPANRIQLAMLLWQDAGNPAPVDETLYTDIDANDADAMQAAQWAVETGLMELPDADNAPDQFDPYAAVSNVDVIHAWKKAQKVKG